MAKKRQQSARRTASDNTAQNQEAGGASASTLVAKPQAQQLILEMIAGGATKVAIAKAVGVTDMTVLSVSQGKTKVFRKMKKLKSVYSGWKAGTLDLSSKRGKKRIEVLIAEDIPVNKKAQAKKPKVGKNSIRAVKSKRSGRPKSEAPVTVPTGFELPNVTEEMVSEVEEQIRRLQLQAKYLRELMKLRKQYGQ